MISLQQWSKYKANINIYDQLEFESQVKKLKGCLSAKSVIMLVSNDYESQTELRSLLYPFFLSFSRELLATLSDEYKYVKGLLHSTLTFTIKSKS